MATEQAARSLNKPKKSLRGLLTMWFLLFSVAPVAFVTGYTVVQFESTVDEELYKRLRGNAREITTTINQLEQYLAGNGRIHAADPALIQFMNAKVFSEARKLISSWMRTYQVSKISLFDREGRLVVAVFRDSTNEPKSQPNLESGDVYLASTLVQQLSQNAQIRLRDLSGKHGLELIVYTKILNRAGELTGYVEEIISIDQAYLEGLQKRLNLEIFLLDRDGRIKVSTSEDFKMYPNQFFSERLADRSLLFFEILNQGTPYVVKVQPLREGEPNIVLGLAASKRDVTNALKGINRALFSVVGVVLLLLVVVLVATSRMILRPLQHLVEAAHRIETGKFGAQIPIESETEIGLLTESFNQMSTKVAEARKELESKIDELERSNKELQEAQAQLVHSAKMVSLGQLVAGIAHELNNPIGFIYSNMNHLREYGEKLGKIVEASGSGPQKLAEAKEQNDYDYIMEDMPRLIKSCEDGAKRVRDIVVGLRNFSRLDEAQIQDVDVNEALDNTLSLLQGELKNRIHVIKVYGALPKLRCYSSQLNQVFMNILSNAAQAIQGKGEITIRTSAEQEALKIQISDTGQGMSSEILEKIFDPFFTTKDVGQGTGLGLSITYGIVKRHGGDIQVQSEVGKGTTFVVNLPLKGSLQA